jgi:hypothetical protein
MSTEEARALGVSPGISPYWVMFAPSPTNGTRWYVIPGARQDGRQIDLLPSVLYENPHVLKEVTWEKPQGMRPHHSYLRKSGSESMELPRFGGQ